LDGIYKKIGADLEKKRMYRWYHIFLMTIKLDVFFFLGFAVQFLALVLTNNDVEKGLTIAALPIILVVLVSSVFAVRRENKTIMWLFFIGLIISCVYFIYKTTRIWDPAKATQYQFLQKYLTLFSIISLLASLLTLVEAIICYKNFDKGLKPYLLMTNKEMEAAQAQQDRRNVLEDDDEDAPRKSTTEAKTDGPRMPLYMQEVPEKELPVEINHGSGTPHF